jgi:hypothetical protein
MHGLMKLVDAHASEMETASAAGATRTGRFTQLLLGREEK